MVLWPLGIAALCAGVLMPVAIHTRSIGRDETTGVQKLHLVPTSRLGGLVVYVAYLATVAAAPAFDHGALAEAMPMALAAMPVVLVGAWEDVTRRVRPRDRLLAAIASGSLASAYAGGIVASLGIPAVDAWLRHLWFALPLTWFMVAGACNAMNLIDGANGLAGGTALIMFGGLAAAAGLAGDTLSLTEALVMMGAILGFLGWNYPAGRVFLGDAGAYFVGFVYAELAIRIVARNDGISAWFVIMLAAYPIIETVFSIYRRKVLRRTATMAPDALHLHSLIFRRVARRLDRRLPDLGRGLANARVAPLLWAHGTLCMALAVAFRENTPALMVCVAGYATLYVASYRTLVRFRNRRIQWTIESQRRLATQS